MKSQEYEKEIDNMTSVLVSDKEKEKGYPTLKQIIRNYDDLVKSANNIESKYDLPYWIMGCFFGKKEDNNETI